MARRDEEDSGSARRLRALDSKMSVIAQRMKTIEKNEKILAKTVTRNNKRIKEVRKDLDKLKENGVSKKSEEDVEISGEIEDTVEGLKEDIDSLRNSIESNKDSLKGIEDKLDEMNYVLNTLNPLEYLTSKEIVDLVDKKIDEKLEGEEEKEED